VATSKYAHIPAHNELYDGIMRKQLSQEELKQLFHYDPQTGHFTRLISRSNAVRVGEIAGCPTAKGYLRIMINNCSYFCHRLAYFYVHGTMPDLIDHIDGNVQNNKILNLREASPSQNLANRGPTKRNSSGFKGVSWSSQKGKWKAQININKTNTFLGLFESPEEAHKKYCEAAKRHYGEYAKFF